MLSYNRFDAFSRGANEILDEYQSRNKTYPDLVIEKNIALFYQLPMYFWFANTNEGAILAKRVSEGMHKMIEDGTYDNIFSRYFGNAIKRLNLANRRIFKIKNPFLSNKTPVNDSKMWFTINGIQ